MDEVPAGLVEVVTSVLRETPGPIRRRKLLDELERRGHRVSLAGLNRTLQLCAAAGLTTENPDGVRLVQSPFP
jgi:Fe2+ or Zn2+ uptake regulation protein